MACSHKPASFRIKADDFSSKKKYSEAIQAYWDHINQRLAVQSKPDWENPYIYLLDIGDLYLEQNKVDQAMEAYLGAEKQGVKDGYINDRLRFVASWYEEHGELEKAIQHLKKYRERDELLFDLMLNRLARKLVDSEDLTPSQP